MLFDVGKKLQQVLDHPSIAKDRLPFGLLGIFLFFFLGLLSKVMIVNFVSHFFLKVSRTDLVPTKVVLPENLQSTPFGVYFFLQYI